MSEVYNNRPVEEFDGTRYNRVYVKDSSDDKIEIKPEYVYLTIPADYVCVYHKLLAYMADFGKQVIDDCTFSCKGDGRNIYNCWNLFQSACAAKAVGDDTKAEFYMNYVKQQLELTYKHTDKEAYNGGYYYPITPDGHIKAEVSCTTSGVSFKVTEDDYKLLMEFENDVNKGGVFVINDDGHLTVE